MESARAAPAGDFVEVGVYKGGSAIALAEVAREQNRRLFLFDTFYGIPLRGPEDTHKVGDFGDTSLEAVRAAIPDAIIVQGIFPYSLTEGTLDRVAIAHIDVDQYTSTLFAAQALEHFMVPGGVMIFDDYDVLAGAKLAVEEAFPGRVVMSTQGKARVIF